ncbi:MAG: hypothetical protein ACK5JR_03425 [Tropicimonas sp.]|uniref:hypothetical protein n=1 Tax=Tropicimonas sp. TaxID=2067044 RepID=UPI003A891C78
MFLELIAAIVAGIAAAGLVLAARRLSGRRLPGWLMPVAAGVVMLLFAVRMEYGWFARTTADFPPDVVITRTHEARALWRPWTYLFPLVDRFVAVEHASIRRNPDVPHQRMADLMFFGRWQPVRILPMVMDCAGHRIAPLHDDVTFDEAGAVGAADWAAVSDDDLTYAAICKEAGS